MNCPLQLGSGTALRNSVSTFICWASYSTGCWVPPLWALCAGKPVPELAWAQPGKRGRSQIPGGGSLSSAGLSWAHPGVGQPGQAPSASGTCCAQSLLARWILGVCKTKLDILLLITLEVTWLRLVVESEIRILSCV